MESLPGEIFPSYQQSLLDPYSAQAREAAFIVKGLLTQAVLE